MAEVEFIWLEEASELTQQIVDRIVEGPPVAELELRYLNCRILLDALQRRAVKFREPRDCEVWEYLFNFSRRKWSAGTLEACYSLALELKASCIGAENEIERLKRTINTRSRREPAWFDFRVTSTEGDRS